MICEIDCRVLGGMQFGVLFEVLVAVRAQFCEIDDRVLWGRQFGVLVQVLFWGAGAGAFLGGRVVGGMQSGVLAGVVDGDGSILDDAWLCHHDAGCIILMLFAPSWRSRTHQDVVAALNVARLPRKGSGLVPQHNAISMIMMLSTSSCRWSHKDAASRLVAVVCYLDFLC